MLVKLLLTAVTLMLMVLAGKRYYPVDVDVPVVRFTLALLISTVSILSIGFVIASIVPTARFAQPIGAIILYPMIGLSGLFVPVDRAAAGAAGAGARAAADLRGVAAAGHLEGRGVVGAPDRHRGAGRGLRRRASALSAKVFRWE